MAGTLFISDHGSFRKRLNQNRRSGLYICPDCQNPNELLLQEGCKECKYFPRFLEDVPLLFSTKERNSQFKNDYIANYESISLDDSSESIQPTDFLRAQTNKLFSYLPQKTGQSICEIGVGQGMLLKKLASLKPKMLVGVDIASTYLKNLVNENIDFKPIVANSENLPFIDAFDLVVSSDVIEHVLNVGNFLYSINRSLKKGGVFVVHTPYLEDYTVYSSFKGCKYDFVHLRSFSRYTLKTILEASGFDVLKFKYDGYHPCRIRFCNQFRFKYSKSFFSKFGRKIAKHAYPFAYKLKWLPNVPNWLGYLLMRPSSIAAICRKR